MKNRYRRFALLSVLMLSAGFDSSVRAATSRLSMPLNVTETAGVARRDEVVRSGVPLPRAWRVTTTDALTLVDGSNRPVPAEFRVLARWNAGLTVESAPIQWVLVSFPARVAGHRLARYRLVADGSAGPNPAPTQPLRLLREGDRVTVDTGAAVFQLGGDAHSVFDAVSLANGRKLVGAAPTTATWEGQAYAHETVRAIRVEHQGPLSAVVVIQGAYALPAQGCGVLGSSRRYEFTAGSPVARVRHVVSWEGDYCPGNGWDTACDRDEDGSLEPNGLRLEQLRDPLSLDLGPTIRASLRGARNEAAVSGPLTAGQQAAIRQTLRAQRNDPLSYVLTAPAASRSGVKADGALLQVRGSRGTVAVAMDRMHRYEPQALRAMADPRRIAVDIADGSVWLGQRQGLFAHYAVGVYGPAPSGALIEQQVWAALNHPLHALPGVREINASAALDELPSGPLPAPWERFDSLLPQVLDNTLRGVDEKGLAGLMTFGHYPRYWGSAILADELECGDNDPTPDEAWDNAYWCATWTDYHNTVASAAQWSLRSGDPRALDEIAFPGAQRQLFTQIMQCGPDDGWFYCGQAPAGYGGYRVDFNSSHAYFDNLLLYYWLTGDETVVTTLKRGGESMRNYLCARRPGQACLPTDPPSDEWAALGGRVASQWNAVFRFLGLASDDAGFLDDWRGNLARAVTQYYVEARRDGVGYGFWLNAPFDGGQDQSSDQLWMATLYDMNQLHRLAVDTDNAPLGVPAITPRRVLTAWARTLKDYGATVSGDGSARGRWPNALYFSRRGGRLNGVLLGVTANTTGDDPWLYDPGKATLTAHLLRAADFSGDEGLRALGADLTDLTLEAAAADGSPLGKYQGEYLGRLPAAIQRLSRP